MPLIDGPLSSGMPYDEFIEMIIPQLIFIGIIVIGIWLIIIFIIFIRFIIKILKGKKHD